MLAALFAPWGTRIFAGLSAALLIACLVLKLANADLKDDLDKARAQNATLIAASDAMLADGERIKTERQESLAEAAPKIERIERQIERIKVVPSGDCQTPQDVMQAVKEGWGQ